MGRLPREQPSIYDLAPTCTNKQVTTGAFFPCCVYHSHELRPCFNHCTTCAYNLGLVKFELVQLSQPGITWRWMLCNDTHVITIACRHWVHISTTRHNMEKYNCVMTLLSLCACARSATHDMIKIHKTHAHENTNNTHDLHHMNEMHHYTIHFKPDSRKTLKKKKKKKKHWRTRGSIVKLKWCLKSKQTDF